MIGSTLRHYRLSTARLAAMVHWYARVFGMVPGRSTAAPPASTPTSGLTAAWVPDGETRRPITLLSICGIPAAKRQPSEHITLDCSCLDKLLNAYLRLKRHGIVPVLALNRECSTSFYYEDPDGNRVELRVDRQIQPLRHDSLGNMDFDRDDAGFRVDPEQFITAYSTSINELGLAAASPGPRTDCSRAGPAFPHPN